MAKKKPGRGRPKIKNPANVGITLRVRPEQKASYVRKSKEEDMEMATWIKSELDKAVEKKRRK